MLTALRRAHVLKSSPLVAARRHGSGGGGLPATWPFSWLDGAVAKSWINRVKGYNKGSNPLGEDAVGLEGALGKYTAGMTTLMLILYTGIFDKKPAAHDSHDH